MARIPAVLSLLAGALFVFRLLQKQVRHMRAALFGAVCFLISPMIMLKLVTAESDGFVSVLLFGALVMWWDGYSAGGLNGRPLHINQPRPDRGRPHDYAVYQPGDLGHWQSHSRLAMPPESPTTSRTRSAYLQRLAGSFSPAHCFASLLRWKCRGSVCGRT